MGHRVTGSPDHSRDVEDLFRQIQGEFLSIPGHAQYFADEIERERAALVPDDDRISFDRHRSQYLRETLKHLPSPETIRVLGNYLFDDRDPMPPMEPGQDWVPVLPNPLLALKTLAEIGLREAPVKPDTFFDYWNPEPLPGVRAWYEEIKSGKRAFSFKGQSVEYRFNPDGTWVSTPIANPPDDAPAPPPAKPPATGGKPSGPACAPPPATAPAPVSGRIWPWITGGVLTVLAAIVYFTKSRIKRTG